MQPVNLLSQYLAYKREIDDAIKRILQQGRFIGGDEITALEEQLASFCGVEYAIACSSGTDALLLALLAAEIKAGDEVIVPSFTFVATAETIVLRGAKPVFIDIEMDTGLLDPSRIEELITAKTRAIIPVSLFGQPPAMDEIQRSARQHNLVVIEDGAQSFGARYKKRYSGNLGDYGCTSFYPTKPLGCYGDGGALFTNDACTAQKLHQLLNHGQSEQYEYKYVGINGRLDTLQAAILQVKLRHFAAELRQRRKIAAAYDEVLPATPLSPLKIHPGHESTYAQYCVYAPAEQRESIRQGLSAIPTTVYYPKPLHLHPAYAHYGRKNSLPHSEEASRRIFSIPIHPFLTESEQERIHQGLLTLAR